MNWNPVIPEPAECRALLQTLSPRERQVLSLVGRGWTTQQAARELGLSTKTVHNHLNNVRQKLGVCAATQAVAIAHRANETAKPTAVPTLLTANQLLGELRSLRAS